MLVPFAKGNFPTASKKCEFYSKDLGKIGQDPLPQYVPPGRDSKEHTLMLLTSKAAKHFLNSSHAGSRGSVKREGEPRLQMRKVDADSRGIVDGGYGASVQPARVIADPGAGGASSAAKGRGDVT